MLVCGLEISAKAATIERLSGAVCRYASEGMLNTHNIFVYTFEVFRLSGKVVYYYNQ